MRAPVVLTATIAGALATAATATAAPPKAATITPGLGMAGAKLGQATTGPDDAGVLGGAPFSGWGRLSGSFCFEGTACSWKVPGGGSVTVNRAVQKHTVDSLITSAPGWRTSKSIGPGTVVTRLKATYPRLTRIRTCDIGGFGADLSGYRLGLHTLFEVKGGKVVSVAVARQTLRNRPRGCS